MPFKHDEFEYDAAVLNLEADTTHESVPRVSCVLY